MVGFVVFLLSVGLIVWSPKAVRGKALLKAKHMRLFPKRAGQGLASFEVSSWLPVYIRLEWGAESALSLLPGGLRALVWQKWIWQQELTYIPRQRGEYTLPKVRLFARDLLGIREVEVAIELEQEQVLVFPEAFSALLPRLHLPLLADGPKATGGLEDASSFAGVREYFYGDSLNRIHWKATARQGRAMVREYDRVRSSAVWLHLDLQSQGRIGEIYTEHAVSLAASLLLAAEQEGLAMGLSSGEISIPLGRGTEHLTRMLSRLAKAQAEPEVRAIAPVPTGVNLIVVTQQASNRLIATTLHSRSSASRVHLIALPEGFFLKPGERGRPSFGRPKEILALSQKRALLEGEGIRVHVLQGNQSILHIAGIFY